MRPAFGPPSWRRGGMPAQVDPPQVRLGKTRWWEGSAKTALAGSEPLSAQAASAGPVTQGGKKRAGWSRLIGITKRENCCIKSGALPERGQRAGGAVRVASRVKELGCKNAMSVW